PAYAPIANLRRLVRDERKEDEEAAAEAESRFHPLWSGRIRESRDRRLAVARCLSLAPRFKVATVRRVCRQPLRRLKPSFRRALQSPARQYCREHRWALVFRLL